MAGWISGLSRPQVGSKEASNSAREAFSYWLSPSVATASGWMASSRSDVDRIWQTVPAPKVALNPGVAESQAMSPAAASTGSGGVTGIVTSGPVRAIAAIAVLDTTRTAATTIRARTASRKPIPSRIPRRPPPTMDALAKSNRQNR